MKQLFGRNAQALFAVFKKSKKNFYSLPRKDLSAFRGVSKTRIFDKSAQVRAIG
jgi:hypothetical protein